MGKRIVLPRERKNPDSEVFVSFLKVGIVVVSLGLVGVLFFSFFSVIFINLMAGIPLDFMGNNSGSFTEEVISEGQNSSGSMNEEVDDESDDEGPIIIIFNETEEPEEVVEMNETEMNETMNETMEEPSDVVEAEFILDRRPVAAINLFRGYDGVTPWGLNDKWWRGGVPNEWWNLPNHHGVDSGYQQGVDWLIDELDDAYDAGYRRISLILPAGRHYTQNSTGDLEFSDWMGSNHWHVLSQERRNLLSERIPEWLDSHPDAVLGIYQGFDVDETLNDIDFSTSSSHTPNVNNPADIEAHYASLEPWVDLGFKEVFWDFASTLERREASVYLFDYYLENYGLRAGGEAHYREFEGCNGLSCTNLHYYGNLDSYYTSNIPAMALPRYFYQWDPAFEDHNESKLAGSSPNALGADPWIVDPENTELFIAYKSGEFNETVVIDVVQRGFIPWTYAKGLYDETMDIWNEYGLNKG